MKITKSSRHHHHLQRLAVLLSPLATSASLRLKDSKPLLPHRPRIRSGISIHIPVAIIIPRTVMAPAIHRSLLRLPRTEAGEEQDEHAEEEEEHGGETGPHPCGIVSVRDVVAVDVVFDGLVSFSLAVLSQVEIDEIRRKGRCTPKRLKSIAMTISVSSQASAATKAPSSEPRTPTEQLRKKATKARKQAMGWRIMARVRPWTMLAEAVLKWVPSTAAMMSAGR